MTISEIYKVSGGNNGSTIKVSVTKTSSSYSKKYSSNSKISSFTSSSSSSSSSSSYRVPVIITYVPPVDC